MKEVDSFGLEFTLSLQRLLCSLEILSSGSKSSGFSGSYEQCVYEHVQKILGSLSERPLKTGNAQNDMFINDIHCAISEYIGGHQSSIKWPFLEKLCELMMSFAESGYNFKSGLFSCYQSMYCNSDFEENEIWDKCTIVLSKKVIEDEQSDWGCELSFLNFVLESMLLNVPGWIRLSPLMGIMLISQKLLDYVDSLDYKHHIVSALMVKVSSDEASRARYRLGCVYSIMRLNRSDFLGQSLLTSSPEQTFESVFTGSQSICSRLLLLSVVFECLQKRRLSDDLTGRILEFLVQRRLACGDELEIRIIWNILKLCIRKHNVRVVVDIVFGDRDWMSRVDDGRNRELCWFLEEAITVLDGPVIDLVIDYVERMLETMVDNVRPNQRLYESISSCLRVLGQSIIKSASTGSQEIDSSRIGDVWRLLTSQLNYAATTFRPQLRQTFVSALMELFRFLRKSNLVQLKTLVFSDSISISIGLGLGLGGDFNNVSCALRTILYVASKNNEFGPVDVASIARTVSGDCRGNGDDLNESEIDYQSILKARNRVEAEYERQLVRKNQSVNILSAEIERVKAYERDCSEKLRQIAQKETEITNELEASKALIAEAEKRICLEKMAKADLETAKQALLDELDTVKAQNSGLVRRVKQMAAEIERAQSLAESTRQMAEQEKQCLERKLEDTKNRLSMTEQLMSVCEAERDEFSATIDELTQLRLTDARKAQELNNQLEQARNSLADAEHQNKMKQKRIEGLKSKLDQYSSLLNTIKGLTVNNNPAPDSENMED